MSNSERFSPRDGWYLVLAFFLLITAATAILLNASYVIQARNADEAAMRLIAGQIKDNFESEVRSAFGQLQAIRQDPIFLSARKNAQAPGLYGSYLSATKMPLNYPYFEIAFWANCKGNQVLKLDVRAAPTPPTGVSRFAFFQNFASTVEWRSPHPSVQDRPCLSIPPDLDHIDRAYLQPAVSANTDEFAPILAAPFGGDPEPDPSERISFQALALRPISMIDPLLPPGYAFAVIDNDCLVLFHSDSFRNLKENFCDESKNKTELRPWLVGGADTSLNITYSGRTQRAYLTSFPLPGIASKGNAFLVVFRDGERQLTVNLAMILVSSILLGVYFLVLVALAVSHLSLRESLRQAYAPGFVWPCRQNSKLYLQMLGANSLILFFYWISYRRLYESLYCCSP